jgi:hypothetical protein
VCLHTLRAGIEDLEHVILNLNLKSREGCTESVRFDKRSDPVIFTTQTPLLYKGIFGIDVGDIEPLRTIDFYIKTC